MNEQGVRLADGRNMHVYDTGDGDLTVLWHHGTPQTGALLDPVVAAAKARDIRVVSYARPSYGTSSPNPGRSVRSVAEDLRQVVDALGIGRFAAIGASGGGTHALACAAVMPDRVTAVAGLGALAPMTDDFDWFAGIVAPGAARAAVEGRAARAKFAETAEFDPDSFTDADWAALDGAWASLGQDAQRAGKAGPDGQVDDDVAYVSPWGFDVTELDVPVLLVHGGEDRVVPVSHGQWLIDHLRAGEFWLRPRDGHISLLAALPVALDWVLVQV